MDIYGAFQLCSIGILTAPVTVRLSRTYFENPGRNIIFLWTGLVLAGNYPSFSLSHASAHDQFSFIGLLSLMVEFYRSNASDCTDPQWTSFDVAQFLQNENTSSCNTCNITCCVDSGPRSPLRGGSSNNIYIIPTPDKLTFNTATLLAAACCIPAILSLVSMWFKILEMNWKTRFGVENEDEGDGSNQQGTANTKEIKKANTTIRLFLSALEVPVYGAGIFAILIIGERNFFSLQVRYQTEPIASIGM